MEVSEEKIKSLAQENMNLDNSNWWDFYRKNLKEEKDKAKVSAYIKDFLNTNSCKL